MEGVLMSLGGSPPLWALATKTFEDAPSSITLWFSDIFRFFSIFSASLSKPKALDIMPFKFKSLV